jgi:hypothetical protein
MGVGVYVMFKMKAGSEQTAVTKRPAPNMVSPGDGIATSMFNDEASKSPFRILIHWTNQTPTSVDALVENKSLQDLPNLSIQAMLPNEDGHDEWSDPFTIGYLGQDGLPAGKGGTLTFPFPYNSIERIHAYYVEDMPTGPVQHEVRVDQTRELPH